jgi:hypothetical protein
MEDSRAGISMNLNGKQNEAIGSQNVDKAMQQAPSQGAVISEQQELKNNQVKATEVSTHLNPAQAVNVETDVLD